MGRVNRFEVDLALAVRMCTAAIDRATTGGVVVSVAVVDAGGHLIAFHRMDGAEIAGPVLAADKAFTAVSHRIGTHELSDQVAPGGDLSGMNSAAAGRYIAFAGGLPLWDGDRVVGGVGVSGGTGAQDLACAQDAHSIFVRERG